MSEPPARPEVAARLPGIDPAELLDALFAHLPVGLQIFKPDGHCLLVNQAFRDLFGSEPPPEYNVLEDEIAAAKGVLPLIHRAFAGEAVRTPAIWYDARELRQVTVTTGNRVAIQADFCPILDASGEVAFVAIVFKDVTVELGASQALEAERDLLRTILDQSGDGILVADAQGVLQFFNPEAERQHGASRQVVAAPEWSSTYGLMTLDGDKLALEDTPLYRAVRGERVENALWRVRRPGGSVVTLAGTATPLRDAEGHRAGGVLITRDETQRLRAEQEREDLLAREREARARAERATGRMAVLQSLMSAVSGALTPREIAAVLVAKSRAATGATAALVALRVPGDDLLTISAHEGYAEDLVARGRNFRLESSSPAAEATRTGRSVFLGSRAQGETRYPTFVAGWGDAPCAIVPLSAPTGTWGALVLSFAETRVLDSEDEALVTAMAKQCSQAIERAGLYEAERAARLEAERANRAKDDFLSVLSHELRSPLNVILGWTRMLRADKLPGDKRMRALEIIQRSAEAQAQLVEDLLDVSRIVGETLTLDRTLVDVRTVVEMVVESTRPSATAKGVELETVLDAPVAHVSGDPARLRQIVANVVVNAIKFTPSGGRVTVRVSRDAANTEIAVTDTGQGIEPGFLPHVFERFRQAEGGADRRHGGLGLGLAIVKRLVERHDGTVTAASEGAGHGATFTIHLPSQEPITTELRLEVQPSHPSFEGLLAGLRVLVVDDDDDARELLCALLEAQSAEVTAATSTRDALEQLGRRNPDVLLADLAMPGEDGFSLIRRVRALPGDRGGAVPAVAVSALTRLEDSLRALEAGFDQHLAKPVDAGHLVTVIRALTSEASERGG